MLPVSDAYPPLTEAALQIWRAGVAAVDSSRLVQRQISSHAGELQIAGCRWRPAPESRICVVGAGKAGAGMAAGCERALGPDWLPRVSGWINVPEDCVRSLKKIHLHGARPAGVNEPTAAGVAGTQKILQQVCELRPQDLCIVLISGGGSALLPAPIAGVTLADKQQLTRLLMRQGATIGELNCIRRHLSAVKGGGLLRACGAGTIVTLIISDVIGDPLEVIASGPTIPAPADPSAALATLRRLIGAAGTGCPDSILQALQRSAVRTRAGKSSIDQEIGPPSVETRTIVNRVIGNNQTAVMAAAAQARQLGYRVLEEEWDRPGEAASAGRLFAERILAAARQAADDRVCLVSGGETTVQLVPTSGEQRGGRNQEFALAAVDAWLTQPEFHVALVSGGTDGEDGPTDAAGAYVDANLLARVRASGTDPRSYLDVNNSYRFFEKFGGLLKTGPTHTNVMDLRVGLVAPNAE